MIWPGLSWAKCIFKLADTKLLQKYSHSLRCNSVNIFLLEEISSVHISICIFNTSLRQNCYLENLRGLLWVTVFVKKNQKQFVQRGIGRTIFTENKRWTCVSLFVTEEGEEYLSSSVIGLEGRDSTWKGMGSHLWSHLCSHLSCCPSGLLQYRLNSTDVGC